MIKRKIVILIGQLGVGGGERQLYLLLKNLDRARFDPVIVSFNPGNSDYWETPIRQMGIQILFIKRQRLSLLRIYQAFTVVLSQKPHVLLSWTLHLNFLAAMVGRVLRIPLVIGSVRNDLFNPMKKDRRVHRWFGTKGVDIFIANSSKGKKDLMNRIHVREERIKVIFNAIEENGARGTFENEREVIRKNFNLPVDAFILINIGRLEASKNQEMLIRVLGLIHREHPNIHTVFAGVGPSLPLLRLIARQLGVEDNVHFLGKVPMMVQYLHAFDVLCHSGVADGMPNVLLEGAITGLPLVSTRVNGSEDIIRDGETGFIVEYNDDELMARRIVQVYTDANLRRALARNVKAYAHSGLFSVDSMAKSFEEVFLSK